MTTRGERLGSYELERRLGVGGMAETFIAVRHGHAGFSQRVCLKRILPAFSADPTFVQLFMEEARIAASLRHSNIVGIIDFGVIDGTYFMALELVEGADLRQMLRSAPGGRLGTREAIYVAMELAHALDHAHRPAMESRGTTIVHRDISPSNVLVSSAGEVKLTDFGIAKAMHTASATQSAGLKGKIAYMAPEQASGGTVDARTDLFALGIVLYESLAGRRPFDGATEMETYARVVAGRYTPLKEAAPEVPPELVAVVESLLAFAPEDRLASAGALIDMLAPLVPGPVTRRSLGELARVAGKPDAPSSEAGPTAPAPTIDVSPAVALSDSPAPEPVEPDTERDPAPPVLPVELDDPAPSVSPDASTKPTRSTSRARRRRVLGIGGAVALSAVGIALARTLLTPPSPPPAAEETSRSAPPAALAPSPLGAPPDLSAEPSADRDRPASAITPSASSTAPPPSRAPRSSGDSTRATAVLPTDDSEVEDELLPEEADRTLAVVQIGVFPWGEVWIDGRSIGPTPVRLTLSPGRHVIEAGAGAPEQRKVVRLRAGHVERVMFNLREPGANPSATSPSAPR